MQSTVYKGNKEIAAEERPLPNVGAGQALVKVAYCGICGTDLHIYHGSMDKRTGFDRVFGHEVSGVVERGTEFEKGARVVARPLISCGECYACKQGWTHICQKLQFVGIETDGGFEEYMAVDESHLHRIPDDLTLRTAGLIEPLAVACHDVGVAGVIADDYVAVIGAGPIGVLIAMVASKRTRHILVSDIDEERLDFARGLGFETVNPKSEDIAARVDAWTNGMGANVVFEVSATKAGAATMTQIAAPRARIVCVGIFFEPAPVDINRIFLRELHIMGARVYEKKDYDEALRLACELPLEKLVSREYPLDRLAEALNSVGEIKNTMKVLIHIGGEME